MSNNQMSLEELQTVTMTTGKLLESPVEDFVAFVEKMSMGELLGLKNYMEAEYERVRQTKDLLVTRSQEEGLSNDKVLTTIEGLYKVLQVIESRHGVVLKFIASRREGN